LRGQGCHNKRKNGCREVERKGRFRRKKGKTEVEALPLGPKHKKMKKKFDGVSIRGKLTAVTGAGPRTTRVASIRTPTRKKSRIVKINKPRREAKKRSTSMAGEGERKKEKGGYWGGGVVKITVLPERGRENLLIGVSKKKSCAQLSGSKGKDSGLA